VLLSLVLALPAGGLAALRGFDGLYGQDAYAYFAYASGSVRESIVHLRPLESFFWPPGYPVLVALAELAIGSTPLAGQLVSLTMGALVPVFTALLVRELYPLESPNLALLAGLLVALCGQLWQSSIVVMADTTGLALATFSAWGLARYATTRHLRWLLAATAALACATLARWIYGLVALPFAAYAFMALPRAQSRRASLHGLAAVAVALALVLPVLGPSVLGLFAQPSVPAAFAGNLQVYSWSPLNALRGEFDTIDGHLAYAQPNGLYYALAPSNLAFFGPLLAPFALLGLYVAARAWPRRHAALVVGWLAVVYAFHAGAPWQNFRFTLAFLPPLAILVASGVAWLWRFRDRHSGRLIVALAALGALSMIVGGVRLIHGFVDRKDDELALVRWVEAQLPPAAQLLSFGPTLAFRHYTHLPTFDLFDLTPDELARARGDQGPVYVVVDEAALEQQWFGQPPATNVLRLRAEPGLQLLGARGSFTLYRVGSA
jgi:hypothetical protein